MQIKSVLGGAAIALVAGAGSVSGNELYGTDTVVDPGTPYAVLDGIATERMSALEMANTRGSAGRITVTLFDTDVVVDLMTPSPASDIDIQAPAGASGL